MERTKDLADCIPEYLIEKIRKNGMEQDKQHVYRVAKRGIISSVDFMGSYEETLFEKRPFKGDLNEIGAYSTSCYLTLKYPIKFLGYLKAKLFKKYPHPTIIQGNTICGLSQLTKERILDNQEEDHIDWWIYKDSFDILTQTFTYVKKSEYERGDLNDEK